MSDLQALAADMRRKYQHALSMEHQSTKAWIKGDPITSHILRGWIPQVETVDAELAALRTKVERMRAELRETDEALGDYSVNIFRSLPEAAAKLRAENTLLRSALSDLESLTHSPPGTYSSEYLQRSSEAWKVARTLLFGNPEKPSL